MKKFDASLAVTLMTIYVLAGFTYFSWAIDAWNSFAREPEDLWLGLAFSPLVLFGVLTVGSNLIGIVNGRQLPGQGYEKGGHIIFLSLWLVVDTIVTSFYFRDGAFSIANQSADSAEIIGIISISVVAILGHIRGLLRLSRIR